MDFDLKMTLDTLWVVLGGILVFWMQAGFAMVETGFTRAKNAGNIIMKNLMDFALGSIIYWILGFGLMFGHSFHGLIGTSMFLGGGDVGNGIEPNAFMFFQVVFCATSATIVSGAMAERTKFSAYLIYSFVISAVIYPISGHWIWGGGWLAQLGFHDFAGSTAVHSVGGWCSLIGASILGPRIGKYGKDGKPNAIPGHSLTLGALGVFILFMGWFGFNPGSSLSATNTKLNALVIMTTALAASAAAVSTMFITWVRYKKPDVSMTLNGVLAGLVGITAGCDAVSIPGAIIIGVIAGFVVVFGIEFVDKVLKVDDPVGAIGVHCLCGVWGTLAVGLFATKGGLFYGGGFKYFLVQLLGVITVAAWSICTALVLFKTIKATIGLRVSREEEIRGLDIEEHGLESSYADFVSSDINI